MIIEIAFLILAVPLGFLLAWAARDELVSGKKWFMAIFVVSVIAGIGFYVYGLSYIGWTFGFIVIVSFISLKKSKDKGWTKRRI